MAFWGNMMKFTLKNIINNLLSVYNGIQVEKRENKEEERLARLEKLEEMLLEYFHKDKESSKKYFSLMQIEYFLVTQFEDLKTEGYDAETLCATFDDFISDSDSTEWYFFESGNLMMIASTIIQNNMDFPYYDYTNLASSLDDEKTKDIIYRLHPDIKSDEEEIKKQKEEEARALIFLEREFKYPLEFFLGVKALLRNNHNRLLVKQYVNEKLRKMRDNGVLFKEVITVILKFFYLYYVTNQFSFQRVEEIESSFAKILNDILEETESIKVLLDNLDDLDIYIDILSEVPIIYSVPKSISLERALTKHQAHVYQKLTD